MGETVLALLTVLIDRWRPETSTFHLRQGELTVTLQDVVVLLGLRIDGPAVTGSDDRYWPRSVRDCWVSCPQGQL